MKPHLLPIIMCAAVGVTACSTGSRRDAGNGHHMIAVVDPGHFHAALVTKSRLAAVDDTIAVYAPSGPELEQYKSFIDTYNARADNPTAWVLDITEGPDYMAAFAADSAADIVVLAGNNRHKTDYLLAATRAGKNVLADKPMAIDTVGFDKLADAYKLAADSGLVIYELMTERYDTINILTREIVNDTTLFGHLVSDPDVPAVTMKSVHHFYKEVSGSPLTRPAWYYDVTQQGEGIADVTTHLLDLVMWQCFPGRPIDYATDVEIVDATHTATVITPEQFMRSTGQNIDEPLEVYSNGTILVRINGILMRIDVQWDFEAPAGSGDTFTATYRGTRGTVEITQDASTSFVKQLSATTADGERHDYDIPVAERLGHEDHFNRVTESFLRYLDGQPLPDWETANTLAKYYITTQAVARANAKN
ncbi:MAG: Gfo/Idh/MocA family oxidoreductase [Muribaculaceae bacterium]|nr:Gfo/Idh/MocA family oxidoreductase [Muribaculaceae bacterium]